MCVTSIIWYRGQNECFKEKGCGWGAGVVPWTQLWGVGHCFHVDKSEELSQLSERYTRHN